MNLFNFDLTTFLAIWGAILSTVLAGKELYKSWRQRARIVFRPLVAECYYETWSEVDVSSLGPAPGPPNARYPINPSDPKRAFIVIEFVVTNHFPHSMMIGRFQIDGWMFDNKYTSEMYGPQRDYRVFDLYSREPISLSDYKSVAPNSSFGLRIEVLDEVHSSFTSMRSRKVIELPTSYVIDFQTDAGLQHHEVAIKLADQMYYNNFQVYRWSNLLGELKPSTTGAPRPQSVNPPNKEMRRFARIWRRFIKN